MDDIRDLESGARRNRTPWNTIEGRVISLVSRKGGVGKTTSAVNLGAALALSGHTVLLVGLDPQCGVCRSLGVEQDQLTAGLETAFTANIPLAELAQPSPLENLMFISPRIDSLEAEETFLADLNRRADDFALGIDRARNLYDTILIDCPPGMGSATRAALLASDAFLVPVQAEELCRRSLPPLLEFIAAYRGRSLTTGEGDHPALEGLFLTMVASRTRMGRAVADRVAEDFGNDLLETTVPRTTRLAEMPLKGKPAVIYARTSAGSRAYFNLADEIVARFLAGQPAQAQVQADVIAPATETCAETAPDGALTGAASGFAVKASDTQRPTAGLDRFLADLGGSDDIIREGGLPREALQPEMVSLDDLLAEEERQSGSRGNPDEDNWSLGIDPDDLLN